jgi:hypothetical protein
MDDAIRTEYQQRLAAGDKDGALAYLRMLRTQSDDPAARAAYEQAISQIEGDGGMTAAAASSPQDAVGPIGQTATQWSDAYGGGVHDVAAAATPAPAEAPHPNHGLIGNAIDQWQHDHTTQDPAHPNHGLVGNAIDQWQHDHTTQDPAHPNHGLIGNAIDNAIGHHGQAAADTTPAAPTHPNHGLIGNAVEGLIGHHNQPGAAPAQEAPAPAAQHPNHGLIGNLIDRMHGGATGTPTDERKIADEDLTSGGGSAGGSTEV